MKYSVVLLRSRCAFTACCLLILSTVIAFGHAILLDSTPSANQVVKSGDLDVALHFNSRVDGKRSQLTLISAASQRRFAPDKQTDPDKLQCRIKELKPGSYRLVWQVLASDGHLTRGQIPFKVE